jgi:hypothetical protein
MFGEAASAPGPYCRPPNPRWHRPRPRACFAGARAGAHQASGAGVVARGHAGPDQPALAAVVATRRRRADEPAIAAIKPGRWRRRAPLPVLLPARAGADQAAATAVAARDRAGPDETHRCRCRPPSPTGTDQAARAAVVAQATPLAPDEIPVLSPESTPAPTSPPLPLLSRADARADQPIAVLSPLPTPTPTGVPFRDYPAAGACRRGRPRWVRPACRGWSRAAAHRPAAHRLTPGCPPGGPSAGGSPVGGSPVGGSPVGGPPGPTTGSPASPMVAASFGSCRGGVRHSPTVGRRGGDTARLGLGRRRSTAAIWPSGHEGADPAPSATTEQRAVRPEAASISIADHLSR